MGFKNGKIKDSYQSYQTSNKNKQDLSLHYKNKNKNKQTKIVELSFS